MNKFLFAVVLLTISQFASAQGNGQDNYQILQMVSPARVGALGGNAMAIKDGDLNLGLLAPSLLDSTTSEQIVLGYTRFFGEANIAHAGYAHHVKSLGTLSFSIQSLGYGDFEMTDPTGQVQGSFSAGEYVFQVGIGRVLNKNFSIGANVKYIMSELAEYKSSAIATDISTTFHKPERGFVATLMMKNIGSSISSYRPGVSEQMPFEIQAGISKKLEKAPLRFGLIAENLQTWDLTTEQGSETTEIDPITGEEVSNVNDGFGENLMRHLVLNAEIIVTKNIHLRVGYNYNRRQQLKIESRPGGGGFTYGLGVRIAKIHISYARAAYSLAGASNHFTLGVKFDDFKKS
ncbi:MAG TPA: type IX secretion system protein PorQ [Cryomorphaceae bacterium]|nr:type IX secretion system protein PorQ [Cryomorphaceae bacterium]